MSQSFDPYHAWLDLPEEDGPLDWYRLLGLPRFEEDRKTILAACMRQRELVLPHVKGPHETEATNLLRRLNEARDCLLSAVQKCKYDQSLREAAGDPPETKKAKAATSVSDESAPTVKASKPVPLASAYRRSQKQGEQGLVIGAIAMGIVCLLVVLVLGLSNSTSNSKPEPKREPQRIAQGKATPAKPSRPVETRRRPLPTTHAAETRAPSPEINPPREAVAEEPEPTNGDSSLATPKAEPPVTPKAEPPLKSVPVPARVRALSDLVSDEVVETPPIAQVAVARPDALRFTTTVENVQCVVVLTGGRAATGGDDRVLRLWEMEGSREPSTTTFSGHRDVIHCAAASSDGRWLLSASADGTVRHWETQTAKTVHVLSGHAGPVTCAAYSPDGRFAASAGLDKTVRYWALDSGRELKSFDGPVAWTRIAFDREGRRVLAGGFDGSLIVCDLGTGKQHRVAAADGIAIHGVGFSPSGREAVVATLDGKARILDIASGQEAGRLGTPATPIASLAISPDGRRVLTGSDDGELLLWRLDGRSLLAKLGNHGDRIGSVAFSPDGNHAASWGWDATLRVWDLRLPVTFSEAPSSPPNPDRTK